MPKAAYYVSVANGLIEDATTLQDASNQAYEFVVHANEEEIRELRRLLDKQQSDEEDTLKRAPIPYKSADHDKATDRYNVDMLSLYNTIYHLGNKETKKHIENMGILGRLLTPDYHHDGYKR
ncbi:MAG: hypothetical protein K0S39_564 [Paenibacillus sp.]|jgi:hypothetical protein|nr:hypothetical protein [Paenibacillus sp.]